MPIYFVLHSFSNFLMIDVKLRNPTILTAVLFWDIITSGVVFSLCGVYADIYRVEASRIRIQLKSTSTVWFYRGIFSWCLHA